MPDAPNSNLPPPHVLEALRRPMWLQRILLTPAEIEALRKRAKENSAYFRKAFAHLRPTAQEAEAEARRIQRLRPSWTAEGFEAELRRCGR